MRPELSSDLAENLQELEERFGDSPDLVNHQFSTQTGQRAALLYLEGLVDKVTINSHILHPLLHVMQDNQTPIEVISVGQTKQIFRFADIEHALFQGKSVLFVNGDTAAIEIETQGWPQRAIQDPQSESTLRGAHQGFTETAGQNISLIRRYLTNRRLTIKKLTVGERSHTTLYLVYLADVARPEIVRELETRIRAISTDAILSTGELEQRIEDNPYTPFPQFQITERPDAAVSQILQGRIAVITDGSPGALIGPMVFVSFFQSMDDYSARFVLASFIRLLRFTALLIAMFLPALYVATISFHYEMLPLNLLLSIGESRAKVPFPPYLEALMMEITLEMLREAGIRLPAPIGQTVGIVGGIVIGEAAVQAGFVSNIMVIIVSLTAIASFIIPNHEMAASVRLIRFPLMLLAAMFGMIGIVVGIMIIAGHLLSLESLGLPYGSPIAPLRLRDWKDTIVRFPLWKMDRRPRSTHPLQLRRQRPSGKEGDE
ncbi:spore germination protein [Tumebacillus sp. BK434]|uniref:spore germination protein n=1 Tax=Tumebacillus sp. BK434 TaxID=2512169 RepID=UPI00104AB58E|nr:spore germination protein [Tumebacillus sp. BK434]TCP59130.1 spore germination protein [Tumebacillus sp. BK434]